MVRLSEYIPLISIVAFLASIIIGVILLLVGNYDTNIAKDESDNLKTSGLVFIVVPLVIGYAYSILMRQR